MCLIGTTNTAIDVREEAPRASADVPGIGLEIVSGLKLLFNKSVRTTMHLKWAFWDILGHFGTTWDILGHFGTTRKAFF